MKTLISLFVVFSLPLVVLCQNTGTTPKNPKDVNFNVVKQQEPYYPAGDQALYSYISNNIIYSDSAKAKLIDSNVMVSFDVLPDSTLSNILIISGPGYGINDEVLRLFKPLKYAPGMMNGVKIKMNTMLSIPVRAH